VALHDISRQETMEFLMRPEDRRTIVALKARFTSLLGRRQLRHTDAGSDLDVQALLEARFTGDQDIFHDDQEVQGFESLLLVDGSASMWSRWATVARAAKVLSQSMSLPCAKLSTWVFSGSNEGVTGIFRFKDPSFGFLPKAQYRELWGLTPMHIALGVGIRHLRHSPGGIRQLFLVTDGRPTQFSSLRAPAPSDLEGETAHQVSEARASGIKVSTLIVGTEIRDASADRMFGKGGWCRVQQHHDDLYREMISLVDRSFTRYLRT
jgi:nitric oxide reductase activation protein